MHYANIKQVVSSPTIPQIYLLKPAVHHSQLLICLKCSIINKFKTSVTFHDFGPFMNGCMAKNCRFNMLLICYQVKAHT